DQQLADGFRCVARREVRRASRERSVVGVAVFSHELGRTLPYWRGTLLCREFTLRAPWLRRGTVPKTEAIMSTREDSSRSGNTPPGGETLLPKGKLSSCRGNSTPGGETLLLEGKLFSWRGTLLLEGKLFSWRGNSSPGGETLLLEGKLFSWRGNSPPGGALLL